MPICCCSPGVGLTAPPRPLLPIPTSPPHGGGGGGGVLPASRSFRRAPALAARASSVGSCHSSPDFVKRMEQAWLISQQPRPIACSSCESSGHVECNWCGGTGFFILGNNMLCEVPSKNTSCVICAGKGSTCCSDCKGTGFRAKWLGEPPTPHR